MTTTSPSLDGISNLAEAVFVYQSRYDGLRHPEIRRVLTAMLPSVQGAQKRAYRVAIPNWTIGHVAALFGVDASDIRRAVRQDGGIIALYCSLRANGSNADEARQVLAAAKA